MQEFDLIIIGAGSGNSILTPDFDDWNVAIVEKGEFGGTCLNRGCIPSKMFVYAADTALAARHSSKLGVDMSVDNVRWSDIVDRVFGRIDPIAAGGEDYRRSMENVTVFNAHGTFVDHKVLEVDGQQITAPNIVLAAGARSYAPPIDGLADVPYRTSDDIMRLPELPEHLIVLGGGFIALEMAHVFDGLGAKVTVVNRSETLLNHTDHEVSQRFTDEVRDRFNLVCGTTVKSCSHDDNTFTLTVDQGGTEVVVSGDQLLVATGRVPNGDELGVEATGVRLDEAGYVITDEYLRTDVEGIWALGDIQSSHQLKHTANFETKVVAHNIANPDNMRVCDLGHVPYAVFSYPQIAAVGASEHELQAAGIPYVSKVQAYGDVAYGWAMEDTSGFCKLLAHPETRQLLGAHLMGPQASTLIHQLMQGMAFGQTVDEMAAGFLYIHPALSELVENALLGL